MAFAQGNDADDRDGVRLRGRHGRFLWLTGQEPGVGLLRSDPGLEEIASKRWYVVHAYSGFEKVFSVR